MSKSPTPSILSISSTPPRPSTPTLTELPNLQIHRNTLKNHIPKLVHDIRALAPKLPTNSSMTAKQFASTADTSFVKIEDYLNKVEDGVLELHKEIYGISDTLKQLGNIISDLTFKR